MDGESIDDFTRMMSGLLSKANSLGKTYDDEALVIKLLNSLKKLSGINDPGRDNKSGFRCCECGMFGHFSCTILNEADLIQEDKPTLL
ncbi:hypothetical protein E3N88_03259 [Mikania micrantha]|uniref:Uncharacterized protein n=1 Tax=Mikania micrantha TaxID=192012 RepID=A0A5N6Q6H5_9ASTR|nr:hypothetical protein E3N88_03259 [Mikania micrantha]